MKRLLQLNCIGVQNKLKGKKKKKKEGSGEKCSQNLSKSFWRSCKRDCSLVLSKHTVAHRLPLSAVQAQVGGHCWLHREHAHIDLSLEVFPFYTVRGCELVLSINRLPGVPSSFGGKINCASCLGGM